MPYSNDHGKSLASYRLRTTPLCSPSTKGCLWPPLSCKVCPSCRVTNTMPETHEALALPQRAVAGGWLDVCGTASRRGLSSEESQATHRAGERALSGPLTSPTDHEGVPYGYCHYTASPLQPSMAREASPPDAPVIPPLGRESAPFSFHPFSHRVYTPARRGVCTGGWLMHGRIPHPMDTQRRDRHARWCLPWRLVAGIVYLE